MGDKTQLGARVDEQLYRRFKQCVKEKHGRTRGVLSHEVENALRRYVEDEHPTEPIHRIEDDVATIQAQIARLEQTISDADGGSALPERGSAPTPSNDESTHTHTDDKPHPKATVDKKVEWLIDDIFPDRESGAYVRADLIDDVRKRYSLSDDAVERMADAMLAKVGAKETPQDNHDLLAWGDEYRSFKEKARKKAREEAEDDFADLEDAEAGAN